VAVEKKYVSITPIQFDLTNYKIIQEVKEWGLEKL
jgi:broad specificity polyphosphatase/5'/3'-nucleotidase SurE